MRWQTSWGTDVARADKEVPETAKTLEQLLAAKEIMLACGSGGVGKTTIAAAAGAMAASRLGGKVLVLTVDPARRLANALGLERFGNVETRVPDEAFRAAGITGSDVYVGGNDATPQALELISQDTIYRMSVDINPYGSGRLEMEMMWNLLNGIDFEKVQTVPLEAVTKANVAKFLK